VKERKREKRRGKRGQIQSVGQCDDDQSLSRRMLYRRITHQSGIPIVVVVVVVVVTSRAEIDFT